MVKIADLQAIYSGTCLLLHFEDKYCTILHCIYRIQAYKNALWNNSLSPI